jgi:hypothetical protein
MSNTVILLLLGCLSRDVFGQQTCETDDDCQYPACLDIQSFPYLVGCRFNHQLRPDSGTTKYCQLIDINQDCPSRPCIPGEYRTFANGIPLTCQKCMPGTAYPSAELTDSYLKVPYTCNICGEHEYQNATGQPVCKECETGTYQFSLGQSSCMPCPVKECPPSQYLASSQECRTACKKCTLCGPGSTVLQPCSNTSNTICGSVEKCALANVSSLVMYDWMTEEMRCRKGEYLWGLGPPPDYTKTCQRCPAGMAGLNGVYCERCGELQRPYHLDQASCVCVESAVMNASGACVCRDGFTLAGTCVLCGRNTYGVGGYCYACPAGTVSSAGSAGPGSCVACAEGSYRSTNQTVCTGCGMGWYAPDATGALGCVKCNTSCPVGTTSEPCPGVQNGANYSRCAGCAKPLPGNASWTAGCAYDCHAGFYRVQDGCRACTVDKACPAGYRASACGADWDANCDTVCTNASKPEFYSAWLVSRDCQWGCQSGYTLVVTDYWMFKVFECVPGV